MIDKTLKRFSKYERGDYLTSDGHPDHGYTAICPLCNARFGDKVFGARGLTIALCPSCDDRKKNNKLGTYEYWVVQPWVDKFSANRRKK